MFIPVRAQIVSLAVTLVFVTTEICLIWVFKTVNVIVETSNLRRKAVIVLYRHCLRLRILAAVVLVSFVGLEIWVSTVTETSFRQERTNQDCLRLEPLSQNSAPNVLHDPMSESILFRCLDFKGSLFEQKLGRVSLQTSNVECDARPYYSYNNTVRTERSTSSATLSCRNTTSTKLGREEGFFDDEEKVFKQCVFYEVVGNLFYLSEISFEAIEQRTSFFVTKIHADLVPLIPKIVDRYFHFFSGTETEELYVRQTMFTDLKQARCSFSTKQVEGVMIPTYIFATVIAIWILAVIGVIVVAVSIRKRTLINLSDPFFWTSKNFKDGMHAKKNVLVDEHGVVTISGFQNERVSIA
ncbi:unnamed protein product [Agarophyton chilense]|eukprot:gb/GEZJ01003013.1/.p1 GENE.gb/GEZJ01003013.1/~~gb/GEZJ01003013.1/.p1  ORF type:complete len:354 (-),score=41.08 gb/GEZJ01003013.1/:3698-4759(-)